MDWLDLMIRTWNSWTGVLDTEHTDNEKHKIHASISVESHLFMILFPLKTFLKNLKKKKKASTRMSTLLIKKKRRKCPVKSGISTELGVEEKPGMLLPDQLMTLDEESWENNKTTPFRTRRRDMEAAELLWDVKIGRKKSEINERRGRSRVVVQLGVSVPPHWHLRGVWQWSLLLRWSKMVEEWGSSVCTPPLLHDYFDIFCIGVMTGAHMDRHAHRHVWTYMHRQTHTHTHTAAWSKPSSSFWVWLVSA